VSDSIPGAIQAEFVDVVVVGGGPAGLSAALAARDDGAAALVIEREDRLGGVLKQCIHDGFGVIQYGERLTGPEYAHRQVAAVTNRGARGQQIATMTGAYLHSLKRDGARWSIQIITSRGVQSIHCTALVMATGCRERTDRQIYLHGDRPAGIFTAGQAQRLINIDGVMPGRNVVVLGSGDIGLIMARRFVLEGARVQGVYEIQSFVSGLARNVAQCLEDWNIPLHLGATVTEVHGRNRVEAVTVCPVGETGIPDHSAAERIPCDTLILSVGLIPENDIIADLGLPLDPSTGGPIVTQQRGNQFPGLYVCGNALIVYDLVDYVSECGRAAGSAAARFAAAAAERHASGSMPPPHAAAEPVGASREISQMVPQLLDLTLDRPPVFFLRVKREMDRATLTVSRGDVQVASCRLTYLRPAEMVRYEVSENAWAALRRSTGPISVSVEAVCGS